MTQTIEQLTARVRELEEENARIREKLLPYPKLAHNTGFFHLQEFFKEILSTPRDTSALDAYVAEKVREAGKFDIWKTNPYTKILETSIKQLTRQRDLAVEAMREAHERGEDGDLHLMNSRG